MFLILVSLLAILNSSASEEDIRCKMNINDLKGTLLSTLIVQTFFSDTDKITINKIGQTKEKDGGIIYSFESVKKGGMKVQDKYISASAGVPETPLKEVNKKYSEAAQALIKGNNITLNKKLIINLDKEYKCNN